MHIDFDLNSILILIGILSGVLFHLITWLHVDKVQEQLDQISYSLYQFHKDRDKIQIQINDMVENTNQLQNGLETLQLSIRHKDPDYRFPTPDVVTQITTTIKDLLSTEILLSSNMKISRKDSVKQIIQQTCQTYPDIDPLYITKKTLAIVQSFTDQTNES